MQYIPKLESEESFEESSEQVGKYIIGKVLGEGQFATVKVCWKKVEKEKNTNEEGDQL